MTRLIVNGLAYNVEQWGEGPPLLLLHGFTGSSQSWRGIVEPLGERFQLIAVDLPGHGRSDAPAQPERYAMAAVAADLERLLSDMDVLPAHLLGYSMGGRLALYLAVTRPQLWRSLVLESASPGLDNSAERAARVASDSSLADWIEGQSIGAFVDRWENLPLFTSQETLPTEVQEAQRAQRMANDRQGLANSLRGMGTGQQPSLWAELDQLDMPVLLIAGALDEKFTAINLRMAQNISGATLEIVTGAGHAIHLEQPGETTDLVLRFLGRSEDEIAKQLTDAKEDDEDQRGQGHLLEPRVQRRQVSGAADG